VHSESQQSLWFGENVYTKLIFDIIDSITPPIPTLSRGSKILENEA